jgi:3'(2'), 5'-bisphosphate nucleotidase
MDSQKVQLIIEGLLEAGRSIMEVYNESDFGIQYKEDQSPVTRADLLASAILVDILKQTGIPVISEEAGLPAFEERKDWKRFWLVDPLDGTKEFISRNGEFTVNIGLIENNKATEGYILIPVQKTVYWGRVNEGCFKASFNDINNIDAIQIMQSAQQICPGKLGKPLRIVSSRSHSEKQTKKYIEDLKIRYGEVESIPAGSSLKFCYLAEGRADLYIRFSPTMEWDTAAGHAIALAAGAHVSEINYNKPSLKNEGLMVFHPELNLT